MTDEISDLKMENDCLKLRSAQNVNNNKQRLSSESKKQLSEASNLNEIDSTLKASLITTNKSPEIHFSIPTDATLRKPLKKRITISKKVVKILFYKFY